MLKDCVGDVSNAMCKNARALAKIYMFGWEGRDRSKYEINIYVLRFSFVLLIILYQL